jgi:hypothetical protein
MTKFNGLDQRFLLQSLRLNSKNRNESRMRELHLIVKLKGLCTLSKEKKKKTQKKVIKKVIEFSGP